MAPAAVEEAALQGRPIKWPLLRNQCRNSSWRVADNSNGKLGSCCQSEVRPLEVLLARSGQAAGEQHVAAAASKSAAGSGLVDHLRGDDLLFAHGLKDGDDHFLALPKVALELLRELLVIVSALGQSQVITGVAAFGH